MVATRWHARIPAVHHARAPLPEVPIVDAVTDTIATATTRIAAVAGEGMVAAGRRHGIRIVRTRARAHARLCAEAIVFRRGGDHRVMSEEAPGTAEGHDRGVIQCAQAEAGRARSHRAPTPVRCRIRRTRGTLGVGVARVLRAETGEALAGMTLETAALGLPRHDSEILRFVLFLLICCMWKLCAI
jgi:hypothetical protein